MQRLSDALGQSQGHDANIHGEIYLGCQSPVSTCFASSLILV